MVSGHNGGLGIRDPVSTANLVFNSSIIGTGLLSDALKTGKTLDLEKHDHQDESC